MKGKAGISEHGVRNYRIEKNVMYGADRFLNGHFEKDNVRADNVFMKQGAPAQAVLEAIRAEVGPLPSKDAPGRRRNELRLPPSWATGPRRVLFYGTAAARPMTTLSGAVKVRSLTASGRPSPKMAVQKCRASQPGVIESASGRFWSAAQSRTRDVHEPPITEIIANQRRTWPAGKHCRMPKRRLAKISVD